MTIEETHRKMDQVFRKYWRDLLAGDEIPVVGLHAVQSDYDENWKCFLFGCEGDIEYRVKKGKVPNWFWRWMQYLIVGNKWIRKGKQNDR